MMDQIKIKTRWIALGIVTLIALYLCWLMLLPFIEVLEWAAVLVILFYPIHKRIAARIKQHSLSALISTLMVIVLIVVPVTFASIALVKELTEIGRNLQIRGGAFFASDSSIVGRTLEWFGRHFARDDFDPHQFAVDKLKEMSGGIARQTVGLVSGIIKTIVMSCFVIFTMYYLFRDSEKILRLAPSLLPMNRKQGEQMIARAREVIGASIHGVVIIGLIQGGVGGLAFWFLGLPSAVLWTFVMMILSMIPMAGAPLVWVPAAISLAATGHWTKAIILVAWGVLIINPIDNFLRPKLVTQRAKLHELFVFFSVIGGLRVFGILGIVLGPLLLALTISLLEVFRRANSEKHDLHFADDPVGPASLPGDLV